MISLVIRASVFSSVKRKLLVLSHIQYRFTELLLGRHPGKWKEATGPHVPVRGIHNEQDRKVMHIEWKR